MSRAIFAPFFAASGTPLLLAQLPPPTAEGLYQWIAGALCVAGLYYFGLKIYKAHKAPPAPLRHPSLDVELTGLAKHERVATIELTIPTLATKAEMGAMEDRIDHRRSVGIGGLHGRITEVEAHTNRSLNEVGQTLARVEANTETNTSAVQELSRKIDIILQRLPRAR